MQKNAIGNMLERDMRKWINKKKDELLKKRREAYQQKKALSSTGNTRESLDSLSTHS
jgi:hypothetical protein